MLYANQKIIRRGANGQIGVRLKIRDLWTFDKHPGSASAHYDCSTQVAQQVDCVSISICAARMVVSVEFNGGLMKHLLMDWCTLQATVIIFSFSLLRKHTYNISLVA
jgi:hypothetical protein